MLALIIVGGGGFSIHAASFVHEKHLNISRMNVDGEFNDTDGTFILHDMQKDRTFTTENGQAKD